MFKPIIIIGAGRSGTNLLRNALAGLPRVATWPCDEINYVWRTGMADHPTDELPKECITPRIRSRVFAAFEWVSRKNNVSWVVEKTCANALRVDYVEELLDAPKYIHITRDGYDVTASAMDRWAASPDLRYLLRKTRFVPVADLPKYATRHLLSHWRRLRSDDNALPTWGPRFHGIDELRRAAALSVVCATQWRRCVDSATCSLSRLPAERVFNLTYERLVTAPEESLAEAAAFLGAEVSSQSLREFAVGVRVGSLGAGRRTLSASDLRAIEPIVEETQAATAAA